MTRVKVGEQSFSAEAVVIAAGAWSGRFGETLGVNMPIYPQRGQIMHLQCPEDAGHWPIVVGFHSHYILTFPGGRIVAGATRENDAGFNVCQTTGGIHEVLSEALRVAPGLADSVVQEVRIGLRPAAPDGLPVLGPVPGLENVFLASGHGPSGLQLGPYSGALIAGLVQGNKPNIDLSPFGVERFQTRNNSYSE